uniref:Retrovirus-related Pol polyprotein from transposon TNT 1-94 n=1 Tax=Trichogramma kaykai TaxID=54128 RepID=A0ABD2W186_9HYME
MRIVLTSHEVFDIVSGDEAKPAALGADATAAQTTQYETSLKAFVKKDGLAQKLIVTSMEKQPTMLILNCQSSKDMWDKLHAVYESKTDTSVHVLQQKWFSLKKDPADDIATHIAKIEDLCCSLKSMKETVSDSMMITKIIMTLPAEYNHFISAWDSVSSEQKTVENLTSRLIMEETRHSNTEKSENALVSHSKNSNNQGSSKNSTQSKKRQQFQGNCRKCGKRGHKQRDCWHNKQDKERPSHQNKNTDEGNALIGTVLISRSCATNEDCSENWLLDSGASQHMTHHRDWFSTYTSFQNKIPIRLGDGHILYAAGKGNINVTVFDGNEWNSKFLSDAFHVPDLTFNLFSMGAALDKNLCFKCDDTTCYFYKKSEESENECVIMGKKLKHERIFKMEMNVENDTHISLVANNNEKINLLKLWHERLAHQNVAQVKKFLMQNNIKIKQDNFECDSCTFGKMHRLPFPSSTHNTTRVGEVIHSDLCGPMEVDSLANSKYFLLFKDDYSGYVSLFFLKNKSEVKDCFVNYMLRFEKETNEKINILRTDNGLEYINKDLSDILFKHGIKHQRTCPHTPQQNGKAERENRTLVEAARTMLLAKNLAKNLWAEAVNTAAYVLNRTRKTNVNDKTPFELWHGYKNVNNYFKVFGCEAYTYVHKALRKKWDAKSKLGKFVGYDENCKGYKILRLDGKKVEIYRDVIFKNELNSNENSQEMNDCDNFSFYKINFDNNFDNELNNVIEDHANEFAEFNENFIEIPPENVNDNENVNNIIDDQVVQNDVEQILENENENDRINEIEIENRPRYNLRNRRNIAPPDRGDTVNNFMFDSEEVEDILLAYSGSPNTYNEAILSEFCDEWQIAMKEELSALDKNKTWTLVNVPPGTKVLSNRWVLKIKNDSVTNKNKFRARLVIKGYLQKKDIDYKDIFSPVARYNSIRTFLAISAAHKLKLTQFDVKSAFLNGDLEEEIFMKQPEGFDDKSGKVCRLHKSLYGLKQSARCWNSKFVNCLKDFGLYPSNADPCVFTSDNAQNLLMLIIYVDDGAIACKDNNQILKLLNHIEKYFEITTCKMKTFLGIEIDYLPDQSMLLHQKFYAEKVVERFNLQSANTVSIPIDPNTMCTIFEKEGETHELHVPYKEAIGSLMFLAYITRPDLSFSVGVLSRFAENPSKVHWNAIKRIIKYLKGTLAHGLVYKAKNDCTKIVAFSDADYANDQDSRKSVSGYLIKLDNSLVSWGSRKQTTVALSTTESEFVAACLVVQELIWTKYLLERMMNESLKKPLLRVDNISAIQLIKDQRYHCRTKHIDIKYKFIRDHFNEGLFDLKHISSAYQEADILTKALNRELFEHFKTLLNVKSPQKLKLCNH